MVWIQRLQIMAHLGDPGSPVSPTSSHRLGFIYQLPTKDCGIVAIERTRYVVSSRSNFFEVLAIEAASFFVRIKEHRTFKVDAMRIIVVIRAFDSGPPQILRDPTRVAPPVCQTNL